MMESHTTSAAVAPIMARFVSGWYPNLTEIAAPPLCGVMPEVQRM
jgi:hypothetical protein